MQAIIDAAGPVREVRTRGPKSVDGGYQDQLNPQSLTVRPADAKSDDDGNVRTKRRAIEWGRDQARKATQSWHGLCLMFVRSCFNVDPLYPDAITAWEGAEHKHRETDTAKWDRGHGGFFRVGEHGHTVLTLGNDEGLSNDVDPDDPGGIARVNLSQLADRWSASPLGTTDDVNGEVAPAPRPRQRATGIEWRRRFLHRALVRARSSGQTRRAARIRAWLDQLRRRA